MIATTARGFNVAVTPRPVRNEIKAIGKKLADSLKDVDPKDAKVFINGKEVGLAQRRKVIAWLSAGLAGIEAYTMFPISSVMAAPVTGAVATEPVIPKEVDDILLKIELICLGICVSVAVIMAMIAGFFRMIGLREEARKRYVDACMGMIQVLTAPAVLGIIALIVRSVMHMFPGYIG